MVSGSRGVGGGLGVVSNDLDFKVDSHAEIYKVCYATAYLVIKNERQAMFHIV